MGNQLQIEQLGLDGVSEFWRLLVLEVGGSGAGEFEPMLVRITLHGQLTLRPGPCTPKQGVLYPILRYSFFRSKLL